jgi:molybdopterin-guanine dinucleotide biosynthesis protein A
MAWSIVIQAGGESRRMGQNKALMLFHGQPLIERVVFRLKSTADELLITTNHPDLFQFLGLPLFPDIFPGKGALGGLFTALSAANNSVVAVVACDMPFINPELLTAERDLLLQGNWDVVIPRSDEGLEPLHAVYRRDSCLAAIRQALEIDQLRLVAWFGDVKVHEMDLAEISVLDPGLLSFKNINTPEEFKQAESLD